MTMWQNKYLRMLTVILLAQAALFYSGSRSDSHPLASPLRQFPASFAGWEVVQEGPLDKNTLDVLKADDTMSRVYVKPGSTEGVNLFVAYFQTQQTGQTPHSPKNCLPGSGWTPTEVGTMTIAVAGVSSPIEVNKYIVSQGEKKNVVLYWYQSHGRIVADEFKAKFYVVVDSIRYHRSDEALVRVIVPVAPSGIEATLDLGTDFIKAAFPKLLSYFPM
jgi:EpsI family protein